MYLGHDFVERERELGRGRLHGFSGQRLRQLRTEHGLTPEELATRIDVHAVSVREWEGGRSLPTPEAGKKLAARFGLSLADLLDIDYDTCLLIDLRSPTGLAQVEAATSLGWTLGHFALTERGARIPTEDEQRGLADLYGVEVSLVTAATQRTITARVARVTAVTTQTQAKP